MNFVRKNIQTPAITWFIALSTLWCTTDILAQEAKRSTEKTLLPTGADTDDPATQPSTDQTPTERRLDELQRAYDVKFEAYADQFADYEERLDELQMTMFEMQEIDDVETGIQVYGFFDTMFFKALAKEGTLMHALGWPASTFIMQNLNLYFASQMTPTLSSIVELRFTFRPLGQETQFEYRQLGLDYERIDTEVDDQLSNEHFRLGGIAIERAHLTWQPRDYLGLVVGYYLTPYGIWNVEHGSPVRLSVRPPYMQITRTVPHAQLGVMVHGRFFPANRTYLDYAVTISNGRGPMDTIMDLDENKAVGLKLKLSYEGREVQVAAGGYGYYGEYTDLKRTIDTVVPEFRLSKELTEKYTDTIASFDFLLEAYNFRFQAEYVWRMARYSLRTPRPQSEGPGYQPDFISYFGYGMLGYTLPLDEWLGQKTLTPYISLEYSHLDDTVPLYKTLIGIGGINFKPSAFVAIKGEALYVYPLDGDDFRVWMFAVQLAVSF